MNKINKSNRIHPLLLLSIVVLIGSTVYAQEVEAFPYQEREWASFSDGLFDSDGNILIDGKTAELDDWQPRPFHLLEPYLSNPELDAYHYLAKISTGQNIEFVKLYGPPVPDNPTSMSASFSGHIKMDKSGNIYKVGITATEEGIGTEGTYHPEYYNNWSDPYALYVPGLDTIVTIPPQQCRDAYIIKFDPQGEKLWGSYYNGNQEVDFINHIVQGGYVYLSGKTNSYQGIATAGTYVDEWEEDFPHHNKRWFLQKIDVETGQPEWGTYLFAAGEEMETNNYGSNGAWSYWHAITSDGYFVYYVISGSDSNLLRILAPDGSLYAELEIDIGTDLVKSIKPDGNGNFYLAGISPATGYTSIGTQGAYKEYMTSSDREYFIAKYNKAGDKSWGTYLFEVPGNIVSDVTLDLYIEKSDVYFVAGTPEQGLATEGVYQQENAGGYEIAFGKLNDLDGSLKWLSYYGGSGDDVAKEITKDQDDNLYIMGATVSTPEEIVTENALWPSPLKNLGQNNRHSFAVKFLHQKNLSLPGFEKEGFVLYPNPVREKLNLQTQSILSAEARLVIYDLNGRKIHIQKTDNGLSQEMDVSKLQPGVYLLGVEQNGSREYFKFVKE